MTTDDCIDLLSNFGHTARELGKQRLGWWNLSLKCTKCGSHFAVGFHSLDIYYIDYNTNKALLYHTKSERFYIDPETESEVYQMSCKDLLIREIIK